MSSTQSQLGSKDPSANSRGEAEKMQPVEQDGNFMQSAAAPPPERAPLMPNEKKSKVGKLCPLYQSGLCLKN